MAMSKPIPGSRTVLGFISPDAVNAVGRAVLITQRDYGDRTNRRHARLKYTIEDRGLEWFKGEVERLSGVKFAPAREFEFSTIQDPHGWHRCADGTWFYGLHILSGRVKDVPGWSMKTALREIAKIHTGDFRLTPIAKLDHLGSHSCSKNPPLTRSSQGMVSRARTSARGCASTRSRVWPCRRVGLRSLRASGSCRIFSRSLNRSLRTLA